MVLRVDRHDETGRGCRLIEVALCNDRETPRRIPVNAWLYQTKLAVSAEGAAVFLPVTDALEDTRSERDDELRRLKLQYRDRLEFAIGRICSVDWTVVKDARRASEVYTTWLPTCQTPQTTAEEISTASLDMTALEKASPDKLRAGLTPIVADYQSCSTASSNKPTRCRSICGAKARTRSVKRARWRVSSARAWSICSVTTRRCAVSGS